MTERIVLIGAGSAVFTRGLVADLIRRGRPCELSLVDIDPDALTVAEKLTAKMVEARSAPIELRASTDRRDVLGGATAVICTIGVGGRRAWERDVLIPRNHGIYQPVGDTVGPGGTSRALRMIPAMVDIAADVLDLAPDALLFNYGNPMAPVCRAVRKATGAKVVGLCHGVIAVARYLAEALGTGLGRLSYTAVGMNHLTWFTEVRVDGQDALGRLRQVAAGRAEAGATDDSPFSWQMLDLFGAFPAVLDRHVTEFFPQFFSTGEYFGRTLGVDVFSVEETIAGGDRGYANMRAHAFSPDPLGDDYFRQFGGEHEQVIEIIDSIRSEAGRVYSANLPNTGQVPNLPGEAVLECPAVADGAGLRPIAQPPLAAGLVGTLATRLAWVETVVEAALEGSRRKFVQALVLDGAVRSLEAAERLADDLLAAQADHLPQFADA
jgi:alpha-galactosidase